MLNEFEKVKVIRPLFNEERVMEEKRIPIMSKTRIDIDSLKPINIQNVNCKKDNSDRIGLMFESDSKMNKYWNDPFKYLPMFQSLGAVCTPDYSVYSSMDVHMIEHSVYMNRWLGCFWQDHGCTVIPTIQWALPDSYNICFSGLEYGTTVIISTVGCREHKSDFLKGFNELKRRINPELIIVYGKMIDGMIGRFVNFDYDEGFSVKDNQMQLTLFFMTRVFEIKERDFNGK